MCVLIIGKSGQVAQSLAATQPSWINDATYWSRETLDLSDPASVRPAVEASGARVIINAAAYTQVDRAEEEEPRAMRINSDSVGELAKSAKALSVPLVHISTDYVFDGALDRPYDETCEPHPLGVYGRSKLAGELSARAAHPKGVIILRTAWVFSPYGQNFMKTMLRLSETRDEVDVVDDQIGNPTSALMIARAIWKILKVWRGSPTTGLGNVYHLTGSNSASWYDFACAIFRKLAVHNGTHVKVNNITSALYPTPAKRPRNSRLETTRFSQEFDFEPPSWEASLDEVFTMIWAEQRP